MYEQIDFRFRYQVAIHSSIYGILLKYLQSKETDFPLQQMVLWSLSAFWHPLAYKWAGKSSETELKQKARNSIHQLQQQINYLAQTFNLDPKDLVDSSVKFSPNVTSIIPSTNSNNATVPSLDVVQSEDDELLNQAFN